MKKQDRYARARRLIENYFGGELEIIDAKRSLTLLPSENDFANAVKRDPHKCGFARTCARLLRSTKVLFFKRAVYIDHFGEDGVRRIYRYVPSTAVIKTLSAFDAGKLKSNQVLRAFILRPASQSQTLAGQRRQRRAWRRTDSGRAIEALRHADRYVTEIVRDVDNTKERLARLEKQFSPKAASVVETKGQLKKLRDRLAVAVDDRRDKEKAAKEVRKSSFNTALSRPRRREVDANIRGGRFFWNPEQASA